MMTVKKDMTMTLNALSEALRKGRIDDLFIHEIHMYVHERKGDIIIPQHVVDIAKFISGRRSKEEDYWAGVGHTTVQGYFQAKVMFCGYEWQSFRLPGGSYTPDFSYYLDDGRWVHIEIKGNKKQRGYDYSRARLRAVACLNPWFIFAEVMVDNGNDVCSIEVIKPDEFLSVVVDN